MVVKVLLVVTQKFQRRLNTTRSDVSASAKRARVLYVRMCRPA